ncbi:MAG: preprotein translocase subunit SecA [Candidatus Shapirobacteria bacterium]
MLKILNRFFDFNAQAVKKLQPLVTDVNTQEAKFKKFKDAQFPIQTTAFKKRLAKGESLDTLLSEALALIREAIFRVVGQRAFDVQIMAAVCLHQGKVAEQKTGEGKTLAAAMAAYVNALTGRGVHIVTVNDYLAKRDTGWYGRALEFAGLSLGCIVHEQAFLLDEKFENKTVDDEKLSHLRPVTRREAYLADVTYGTNNEYGFDYLRDNMVRQLTDKVQRGHHYAIVDEADSILIDEARTPLIISAPDTEPTQKYYEFAKLIRNLSGETDFTIDEKLKIANLTEHGIKKVEKLLGVDNLYEKDFDTIHHIENALRARTLFLRDKDYVVKDNQVTIVDEFTGRLMFGRRWSDGLHQAVEAKEGVVIQQESITLATISFQNYFRLYEKLAGMTGTAATEAEEFNKIYQLEVVSVPTNKPMIRADLPDIIFKTTPVKYAAVVKEIAEYHARGQPVLVGTTSIEKNEIMSKFLTKKKIKHQVLNAKRHEREAAIIAQAGKLKTVTVATNMAGRGVDIILGGSPVGRDEREWQKEHAEVVKLGGLHIIGTERHESRRIDNQLRGRAGRQGDPGSSRFFVSLDDDIMRLFGGEQIKKAMEFLKIPEDQPIEHAMISKSIEQAQVKVEGFNFDRRKQVVEYGDVMNKQREIIYRKRDQILTGGEQQNLKEEILGKLMSEIENFGEIIPFDERSRQEIVKRWRNLADETAKKEFLLKVLRDTYEQREKQVGAPVMREMEKFVYLASLDRLWIDHLDQMDDLREGIGLRGYGQQDPLVEYKKEAYASFERLMRAIDFEVNRRIFRVQVGPTPPSPIPVNVQTNIDTADGTGLAQRPVIVGKKFGRNDPCWCGSGKKWKRCHYPQVG